MDVARCNVTRWSHWSWFEALKKLQLLVDAIFSFWKQNLPDKESEMLPFRQTDR